MAKQQEGRNNGYEPAASKPDFMTIGFTIYIILGRLWKSKGEGKISLRVLWSRGHSEKKLLKKKEYKFRLKSFFFNI